MMPTVIGKAGKAPRLRSSSGVRCARRISRRRLLRVGGAGLDGGALLGVAGCSASGEGAEGSTGTRTVRHESGRAEVPVQPRRVVAMNPYASLQTALAVGSPVVGWVDWIEYHESYDELSRIAPTVAAMSTYGWKENSRVIADALNARQEIEGLISDYEDRAGKLKGSLRARSERPKVSMLKPREAVLEAYTDRFYVGRIPLDSLCSNPLWGRLRAVKAGRVHGVAPNAWFITSEPQAASVVLDDLEKYLLGGDG